MLTKAYRYVSVSVSQYLLCEVRDLNVNIIDRYGNTALHYAVWCSKNEEALLHAACRRGDVTEVWRLVRVRNHNINEQDNTGYTYVELFLIRELML